MKQGAQKLHIVDVLTSLLFYEEDEEQEEEEKEEEEDLIVQLADLRSNVSDLRSGAHGNR